MRAPQRSQRGQLDRLLQLSQLARLAQLVQLVQLNRLVFDSTSLALWGHRPTIKVISVVVLQRVIVTTRRSLQSAHI